MSLLYGATSSLDLATMHDLAGGLVRDDRVLMLTGVVFIVVGIAFKFGAAPFHMLLPDTCHRAPTSLTMFIAPSTEARRVGKAGFSTVSTRLLTHPNNKNLLI